MEQGSSGPPPPLPDEALGAVIQLAHAASRPDSDASNNNTGNDNTRASGAKGRGTDLSDNQRASKHVRMDNGAQPAGMDAQALSWAQTAPPAYPGHGLDQNGLPLSHGEANAFDPATHGVATYGDQTDQNRMAPPPPVQQQPQQQHQSQQQGEQPKHLTSEQTGLVGARGKTGMTRTLSTSRRAEQNRNAQRVFRERKNKYIADLESKAASLESALLAAEEHRRRFNEALETIDILKRDNDTLRVALRALGGHQAVPNAPALPIDRASHTSALLPTAFAQQHAGAPAGAGRPGEHHDHSHAQGQGGMHDSADQNQDPATAAAVAAAASGGAPYWLLEAVSNANQQHGFPVSSHFSSQLGDGSLPAGAHTPMHPNDPNAMRARSALTGQRAEGMLDPSLEHAALGDNTRSAARVPGDESKGNESLDVTGNPDNLASLSAVAAAAAAAASQKVNN
ncbi:RNA polymerase II transcription regulator complex protein [Malassezia pachydermatis]|uniref:BZIP domain-containing protein n=1 Tax=Malassezia pachydermatis TaxID=77020 RepID=A0A0M8MNY4_9BASI|nr:hypothetical protein Malapachy_2305 [Malassezia pachydermatis]KOS15378.1 hypothetical protein Malapachy_2305 [Malassezia pachydermatis]